ncbi:flagellar hook-associated protein FlgL [Clostridium sp. Marseille-Q7071]
MRITDRMLSDSFLNDMYINLNNMKKIQEQRTSGKAFKRPSDNPFAVSRSMQMYGQISANEQYNSNIKDTINWLSTTDTTLDQSGKALARIRELMHSSANAAYGSEEHRAIKDEINEKIAELSQVLNTTFDGKYILGGTRGDKKPTAVETDSNGNTQLKLATAMEKEIDKIKENLKEEISIGVVKVEIDKNGVTEFKLTDATKIDDVKNKLADQISRDIIKVEDDGSGPQLILAEDNEIKQIGEPLKIEISQGVVIDYSISATEVLNFKYKCQDEHGNDKVEQLNLSELLKEITSHLDNPDDLTKVANEDLAKMDSAISNFLTVRSKVGAMQNRMESAESLNKEQNMNLTEILSHNEDVDVVEKSIEYATMLTVYMSALQTSAQILQPSLIDYLR